MCNFAGAARPVSKAAVLFDSPPAGVRVLSRVSPANGVLSSLFGPVWRTRGVILCALNLQPPGDWRSRALSHVLICTCSFLKCLFGSFTYPVTCSCRVFIRGVLACPGFRSFIWGHVCANSFLQVGGFPLHFPTSVFNGWFFKSFQFDEGY